MPMISYAGQSYDCAGQSVLACLTANGIQIPSSCRSGICQSCMMRLVKGSVPDKAKSGLKPTFVEQNYFLACSCTPEVDIEIVLPESGVGVLAAQVSAVEYLAEDILGVWLKPAQPFTYRPGQFIRYFKDDEHFRCYSLASVPELDENLFLNIRRVKNGLVSNWMFESLSPGTTVTISDAAGDCFYAPGKPDQNMLLLATGTGLAPLYGIICDALNRGHTGRLRLYHGSNFKSGLYLVSALRQLEEAHKNFSYVPCLSEEEGVEGISSGTVLDVALKENPNLSGWRVFLCGNPDMVKAAKKETFFSGASLNDILADPF